MLLRGKGAIAAGMAPPASPLHGCLGAEILRQSARRWTVCSPERRRNLLPKPAPAQIYC